MTQSKLGFLTRLSLRRIALLVTLFTLVGGLTYVGLSAFQSNIGMHSWLTALQIWKNSRHHFVECAESTLETTDPSKLESCEEYVAVFDSHKKLRQSVQQEDWQAAQRHLARTGLTQGDAEAALGLFELSDQLPAAASAVEVWSEAMREIDELRELIRNYRTQLRQGGVSPADRQSYLRQFHQINESIDVHEARFGELLHEATPQARYVAVGSIVLALLILVCAGIYLARLARRFETQHQHVERRLAHHEAKMMEADRMIAVGMLAAGVGHEINNPLTYVAGGIDYAHLTLTDLLEDRSGERERLETILVDVIEALEDAREGTTRVRDIARDLRTFSRRGDSKKIEKVNLVPILDLAIDMAEHEIRHRAQLVRDYQGDSVALGNESRLAQVFLNLVINAAQAIEEGGVDDNEVRVLTYKEGDEVVVEVHDTGKGISPAQRELVFEPFRTTKPEGQGTGLGLAISRNIVESMGGSISFESTSGEGTVFQVRLPAAEPA
jgi:signal transduction histidine kinase